MRERNDFDLLQDFAQRGSQPAFAEVVRRHVDLVYSAAARQVRDRHAAEDVTQVVFIVLARKARRLRPDTRLSAWLLGVTRLAARDWRKAQARRAAREHVAAQEKAQQMKRGTPANLGDATGGTAAAALAPEGFGESIDDAMASLSSTARQALVLRFFEGKSFREVGNVLGISEPAAKQRVFRALERLRALLGARGAQASSAESLGVSLAAIAVLPAPAGLATTVAGAATSAAAAAQYAVAVKGVTAVMAWAKAKVAAVVVVGTLIVGGAGATAVSMFGGSREEVLAPSQPTMFTTTVTGGGTVTGTLTGSGYLLTGVARLPDGRPVANATVQVVPMHNTVLIYGNTPGVLAATTGENGKFTFNTPLEPAAVIVRNDQFIGVAIVESPGAPIEVKAQRWGRIEGTVLSGGKPVPNADLFLWQPVVGPDVDKSRWVDRNRHFRANRRGQFVVDRVLPGDTRIDVREGGFIRRAYKYQVNPGRTVVATLADTGRAVVGRVNPPMPDAGYRRGSLTALPPEPPLAARLSAESQLAETRTGRLTPQMHEWMNSPQYQAWERRRRSQSYILAFTVDPDGSFKMPDVPPGRYNLTIHLGEAELDGRLLADVALGSQQITVPLPAASAGGDVFDVGEIKLAVAAGGLVTGAEVPNFGGVDDKGKPWSLRGLRGKHVLLHVAPPGRHDDPNVLNVLYDWLNDDDRLVMVTAHAAEVARPERRGRPDVSIFSGAVPDGGVGRPWTQVFQAPDKPLPDELLRTDARLMLIDPAGRLLARARVARGAVESLPLALPKRHLTAAFRPGVKVATEHVPADKAGRETPFSGVPAPAKDDAATGAAFSIVDGKLTMKDGAGTLKVLVDGRIQPDKDSPQHSAFFDWNELEGRLRIDLGRMVAVGAVNTYSWHKNERAAQVYQLYASDGSAANFNPAPKIGTDPAKAGWTRIASVDTRPANNAHPAGRHAVSIAGGGRAAGLGAYRYLLFEVFATETKDEWGQTFYGEVDVVEHK